MSVVAPERPVVRDTPAEDAGERARATPVRTAAAGFLASAAAGWMAAGLFPGALPRATAILGCALGAGIVLASHRSARPAAVQALVLPAALLAGAAVALPAAGGGSANLPRLVSEALRSGGLAQPPVPFDPGWRFLIVLLGAVLGASSVALATAFARPKLAVALPAPAVMGAALIQPEGTELLTSTVAIGLALGALAISYGGELAGAGEARGRFEVRRLARGAGILAALAAGIVLLSRAGFLFPETTQEQVIPPQRPPQPVPQPDRPLFRIETARAGPWRLGVLDVYDGSGWLLPPSEPGRLLDLPAGGGAVPGARGSGGVERATFEILDVEGHVLPTTANPLSITGFDGPARFDPRTATVRLTDARPKRGTRYVVESAAPARGADLADAGSPPADVRAFLDVPPAPNEVVALLADAPENPWDRLQFVRARFYSKVVAAGAGNPIDVPPHRAAQLLGGAEGTPWEITAAEALLARWAGVPARIGYGFARGDRLAGGTVEVRPRHGATWLETYFDGFGWVPIVGTPPRARSSLSSQEQNPDANVQPTDELALVVHVPIRLRTVRLVYVVVRYWVGVVVPILAAALLAWWAFPGVLKVARRIRRRRWAERREERDRLGVAYAEMRDLATDLGIGDRAATPLGFCATVEDDDEHRELAWLVTRALWGDLRRDLRDADVASADDMARSIARRIGKAQPAITRVLAFASRASLREPYSGEIPNLWPSWAERGLVRARVRAAFRRARRWRKAAVASSMLALVVLASACGGNAGASSTAPPFVVPSLPKTVGPFELRREPRAEEAYARAGPEALVRPDGVVYTVRRGDTVEASLQIARFKPGYDALERDVREGVLGSLGAGRFQLRRVGEERVHVQILPEQRMLLWFTPDGTSMLLLVARRVFAEADPFFLDALRFVQGRTGAPPRPGAAYDPRRGGEP